VGPDFDVEAAGKGKRVALVIGAGQQDGARGATGEKFVQRVGGKRDGIAEDEAFRRIERAAGKIRFYGGIVGMPEGETRTDELVF